MDVSPRPAPPADPPRRSRGPAIAVGVLLAGALVFVIANGLSNATLFFLNVDEAVAQRADLGDDRFRMQGNPVSGSIEESDTEVVFDLRYEGEVATVVHSGNPPDLFQPGIPVVVEGSWDGEVFRSDRMLIRHDEEYEADNSDRLADAEADAEGGDVPDQDQPFDPDAADTDPVDEP